MINTMTHRTTPSDLIDSLNRELENQPEEQEEWLSPQAIAEELNLHINTVYRMCQSGQLPVYNLTIGKTGTKYYYRVKRSDLDNWLEERRR